MKKTQKEYKQSLLKEQPFPYRMLHKLGVFHFEVLDNNVWKDNNDYNYNIKLGKYNPLTYVVLLFLLPLAFLLGGFNRKNWRGVKKELKSMW